MLLGLATIIGGTNPRAVGSILLFCFFAISHIRERVLICAAALVWTILLRDDWHHGSGGLLVVSFLTSVAIGMALELGQLLLNHVCCKCCPCHDDDAITDAPAGQRADVVVAQPAA